MKTYNYESMKHLVKYLFVMLVVGLLLATGYRICVRSIPQKPPEVQMNPVEAHEWMDTLTNRDSVR